ncbi:MAG: 2Fe-2S iron-sulfur cluster-binding protein [Gemmatimonadetes bacterium]|nr:2Fe-2S iron-sulfur cluster-binding protein [Gemmatimonadota bacterium]
MVRETIRVSVNGEVREDGIETSLLLVRYLRDVCDLRSTREACETTRCGACMVLLDGLPVKSCTLFAVQAHGAAIETIEGIEAAGEHPIRRELRQSGAPICSDCVDGRIVAAEELLRRKKRLTEGEVERALDSNRCACASGPAFIAAVLRAAASG